MSSQKKKSEGNLDWNSRLDEPNKKKKLKMKKRVERAYIKEKTDNKKQWEARKIERKKSFEEKAKQKEERILIKEAKFKYKSKVDLNQGTTPITPTTLAASQSKPIEINQPHTHGKFPIENCPLECCPKKAENNKDRSRRRSLQKIQSIEIKYRRARRSSSESSNSSRSRSPIIFRDDSDEEKVTSPTTSTRGTPAAAISQENPFINLLTGQLSKAFRHPIPFSFKKIN